MTEHKQLPAKITMRTRYQEQRYRITEAGRSGQGDDDIGQFLFAWDCCNAEKLPDGSYRKLTGHKADCKGRTIGEIKEALFSTTKQLEDELKGKSKAEADRMVRDSELWTETARQHRRGVANMERWVKLCLSGGYLEKC